MEWNKVPKMIYVIFPISHLPSFGRCIDIVRTNILLAVKGLKCLHVTCMWLLYSDMCRKYIKSLPFKILECLTPHVGIIAYTAHKMYSRVLYDSQYFSLFKDMAQDAIMYMNIRSLNMYICWKVQLNGNRNS